MSRNVRGLEQIARVILAIIGALLAWLMGTWPTWGRVASGVVAAALLVTAVVGY